MTMHETGDWFAFNDAGRPVAVAAGWHYPTIGSIVAEDPDPSSPWVKYRDIRWVTDQAERGRYLDVMAGKAAEPDAPAAPWEQLTLTPNTIVDSLADAVAAYASVSPELVQVTISALRRPGSDVEPTVELTRKSLGWERSVVIPNREGTPSDQTGGAS